MAKVRDRVIALVAATVFFLTSVGVTVLVIMQVNNQNKAQSAFEEQLSANQDEEEQSTQNNQQPAQEATLQGTTLADFTPQQSVTELQKIDIVVGTGEEVKPGATINAHYTGALAKDGIIFQSSHDFGQSISFGLGQVIKGWTDGVPGMKVGGKRRLLIPAALAYGSTPPAGSGIPADADLVFDIELVKIDQQ